MEGETADDLFLRGGKQLLESSSLSRQEVCAFYSKWSHRLRSMTGLPPDLDKDPLPALITLLGYAITKLEAALYGAEPKLPRIAVWESVVAEKGKRAKAIKFPLYIDLEVEEGRMETFRLSMTDPGKKEHTFRLRAFSDHEVGFCLVLPKSPSKSCAGCSIRWEDTILLRTTFVPAHKRKEWLTSYQALVGVNSSAKEGGTLRLRRVCIRIKSASLEKVITAYLDYKNYRQRRIGLKGGLQAVTTKEKKIEEAVSTVEREFTDVKRKREELTEQLHDAKRQRTLLQDSLALLTWTPPPLSPT